MVTLSPGSLAYLHVSMSYSELQGVWEEQNKMFSSPWSSAQVVTPAKKAKAWPCMLTHVPPQEIKIKRSLFDKLQPLFLKDNLHIVLQA